jgi:hypothetical protein
VFSDVEIEARLALAGAGDILGHGVPPVPEPAPAHPAPTRPGLYDEDDACWLGQAGEGFLPAAA